MHRAIAHRQARSANRVECTPTMRTPKSAERYLHSGRSRNPEPQSYPFFLTFLLDNQIRFGMGRVRENTEYILAQHDKNR